MSFARKCSLTVISLYLLLLTGISRTYAQEIPPYRNFTPSDYNASHQNWSLAQDKQRWIFSGNSDGLLIFNGSEWKTIKSAQLRTIRSVAVWKDNVYMGGYGEIGLLDQTLKSNPTYKSLVHLVKDKTLETEEIWNIVVNGDKLYFQSFSVILEFNGQEFRKITPPGNIMFIHNVNGRLLVQVIDSGIYEIHEDGGFELLADTESFKEYQVTGILAQPNDALLISTAKHGIFRYENRKTAIWNKNFQSIFIDFQINKFIQLPDGRFAAGTIRNGILVLDNPGNIVFNINKKKGLQNNTILSLMSDIDGNIWTGLDKGISMVKLNSDILIYPDTEGQLGTVYSAIQDSDGRLFLGTNQGIYYNSHNNQSDHASNESIFRLLPGTQGHVWQLIKTGGGIIAGHNDGTFMIRNLTSQKISDINGGYCTVEIPGNKDLLLQGSYTGLIILLKNKEWSFSHRIMGFSQPVKYILPDSDGHYWICGPVSGIYRIKPDKDFRSIISIRQYGQLKGLESDNNPEMVSISGEVYIKQHKGYSRYDRASDRFIPDPDFAFERSEYQLRNGKSNEYFKFTRDSVYLHTYNKAFQKFELRLQKDYYNVTILNNGQYHFCMEDGYAVTTPLPYPAQNNRTIPIIPDYIKIKEKGIVFDLEHREVINLQYNQNDFEVYFHQPVFQTQARFRTQLEGHDREWSEWSPLSKASFNNIRHGKYTLWIASSVDDQKIKIVVNIAPPWFRSWWAYIFYILLSVLLIKASFIYFNHKIVIAEQKIKSENERILREHKTEMDNQRLQAENIAKSKELANSTIHLVKKNELLLEIKEELSNARKNVNMGLSPVVYQKLVHLISENITSDEDWNLFESSFTEVHKTFMKKLKQNYPELSPADLKLAAFLKMDMTSKEIAPLFNISLRGLENKRYRLRKKIGLPNEANLNEFFMNFD
jgi:DNA-binding CsgD family transcriptional regulator